MAVFNNILAGAAGGGDAPAFSLQKSVRLTEGDDAHLSKTFASAGNRKTWTWSCWFKLGNATNTYQNIYSNLVGNTNGFFAYFANDILYINDYNLTGGVGLNTTRVFRDKSAWYHLVIRYDTTHVNTTDRVRVYINGVQEPMLGYWPDQNVDGWWNNAQLAHIGRQSNNVPNYNFDGYLADINFIDGQSLAPTSFGEFDDNNLWQAKKFTGTYGSNGYHLFDFANESGIGNDSSGNNNDWTVVNISSTAANYANAVSAASNGEIPNGGTPYWIDILPTNADLDYSGSDFTKVHDGSTTTNVYWVGNEYTAGNVLRARFDLRDFPSISTLRVYGGGYAGYVAYNYQLLDSSKSAISGTSGSFGTTHTWHSLTISGSPRYLEISCTSGTSRRLQLYAIEVNGTVLANSGAGDLDVMFDVPTNSDTSDTGVGGEVSGCYATLNPNILGTYKNRVTLTNGNLKFVNSQYATLPSTIAMSSGKWYCEGTLDALASASNQVWAGLLRTNAPNNAYEYFQGNAPEKGVHYWGDNTGLNRTQSYGVSYATVGTVIGIAFDADAGSCTWYVNGSSQGSSTYNIDQGEEYYFSFGAYVNGAWTVNFGQRPFAYTAPSGYKALCTTNLSDPTIADGSDYFDVVEYSGSGYPNTANPSQSITGLSFSPDVVWSKATSAAYSHGLFDSVRGANKFLRPNGNQAESTDSGLSSSLVSFDTNGFTLGPDAGVGSINYGGTDYVAWTWDAGSSTVSNTDGSVTSSVKTNPSAGISIVSWTSSNANGNYDRIGHGLNALPGLVITKRLTVADEWYLAHGFDLTQFGKLNSTAAFSSAGAAWGNGHTSSVISLRVGNFCGPSENLIAYCFAPVEGYSAFGAYEGNGNIDGPFVYLGFRPALLVIKGYDFASNWFIHDNKRPGYNVNTGPLRIAGEAQLSVSTYDLDILSNGFKMRTGAGDSNQAGKNFSYFAFAENPFQTNGGLAR